MAEHAHGAEGHPEVGHVVPLKILFGVLGTLLFLTFITVAVTWVDLGEFNLVVAMAIALVKAVLVCLYFMHLRWDRPFNTAILLFAMVLVVLFVVFSLLDSGAYQPSMIPGYAPGMER